MELGGLMKMTLLDFPGKVACTVFTKGCNMRCPFCHNASLVTGDGGEKISEDDFFLFLKKRQGLLDGVAITGGEPLLHNDIRGFMKKIKDLGFAVKLDTNGTKPGLLKEILDEGLADYVAVDIKNDRESYADTCGVTGFDVTLIDRTIKILKESGVDHEFRTTVVKPLHDSNRIGNIAKWIGSGEKYYLQVFKDSGDLIEKERDLGAYGKAEMEKMLEAAKLIISSTQIRGE